MNGPCEKDRAFRRLYAAVFLSGMGGLIYQVSWHRYLAILLGSHARAAAAVLAVFLGGLGAGYLLFGRFCDRPAKKLLSGFIYVELGLGVLALLFPPLFRLAFAALPRLDASLGVGSLALDLFFSALLVGPPAVLMGATLPLLTQALGKDAPMSSRIHARVYGLNTVGAALGAALGGYVLIPALGLPSAMRCGALFNLFACWLGLTLSHRDFFSSEAPVPARDSFLTSLRRWTPDQIRLALVALLSGFYVLTIETVLIRLTALSAGSSDYHFALIVSIFIVGLGVGPLLDKNIEAYTVRNLIRNQIAAAVSILLLLRSGDSWPYAAHLIRIPFRDAAQNYYLHQAFLGLCLFSFLIIPVGVFGRTLPLCFHLIKGDSEELGRRAGWLYGANTVGSVLGCLLGGYLLFYAFNIDGILKFALFACAASVFLLVPQYLKSKPHKYLSVLALSVAGSSAGLALTTPPYRVDRFIQPFRQQDPNPASYKGAAAFEAQLKGRMRHLHYEDGPNTSVGIGVASKDGVETSRSIIVNGKSDGDTGGDRFTAMMLGHLAALLNAEPKRACVIGFGTGITAGVLAAYDEIKEIDVVEISPVIVRLAGMFDAYNGEVSKSPKVAFRTMDAFRFLQGTDRTFDIVVSEPSNPWVAGVENLYSREFYAIAKKKMTEGGVFVQWVHAYSFTDDLMRTVLRTMNEEFTDVHLFQLGKGDRAVIGRMKSITPDIIETARKRFDRSAAVRESLALAGVTDFSAIAALEEIPPGLTAAIGDWARVQTLENPSLSHRAAIAFFAQQFSDTDALRRNHPGYYLAVEDSLLSAYAKKRPLTAQEAASLRKTFCEHETSELPRFCRASIFYALSNLRDYRPTKEETARLQPLEIAAARYFIAKKTPASDGDRLAQIDEMLRIVVRHYSPIARFPLKALTDRMERCGDGSPPNGVMRGECLIRRLIFAKLTRAPEDDFRSIRDLYRRWFAGLPEKMADYKRYKTIRDDSSEDALKTALRSYLSALPKMEAPGL